MRKCIKDWWNRFRQRHQRLGSRYEVTKYCLERASKERQKELRR